MWYINFFTTLLTDTISLFYRSGFRCLMMKSCLTFPNWHFFQNSLWTLWAIWSDKMPAKEYGKFWTFHKSKFWVKLSVLWSFSYKFLLRFQFRLTLSIKVIGYSYNKITKTWIQTSRKIKVAFSQILASHQRMIKLTLIVSR